MRRHGLGSVHQAILAELLGIGSRFGGMQITDTKLRAKLLLLFVEVGRGTLSGSVALNEALNLETTIDDPHYSYEVVCKQVQLQLKNNNYDLTKSLLKRMLKCAHKTGDLHVIAQSREPVGELYSVQGNHERALKWY